MTEQRPLPDLDELDTKEFWARTAEHKLVFKKCGQCHQVIFYPRDHCPECGSLDTDYATSEGRGRVYTFTIVRQHALPFFQKRTPYAVAYVELDEGFRILSEVAAPDVDAITVGTRVTLAWEDHDGFAIPLFEVEEEN